MQSEEKREAGERVIYLACLLVEWKQEQVSSTGARKESARTRHREAENALAVAVKTYKNEN